MKKPKTPKILIIISLLLVVVQIPFYLYGIKDQVKTTATVIRIDRSGAGCTGDRPGRPDPTCDHSDRLVPVYEYFDSDGNRYEQDDRFFGEYKENNPLRRVFGVEVGDEVPAFYTESNPEQVLFMSSIASWMTSVFLPATAGILLGFVGIVWLLITDKMKQKSVH